MLLSWYNIDDGKKKILTRWKSVSLTDADFRLTGEIKDNRDSNIRSETHGT